MSHLIEQQGEITCHFHQVVDLQVCQLLNLKMRQQTESYCSQPERINLMYLRLFLKHK